MAVICLTGGIASGKSTAARFLANQGAEVLMPTSSVTKPMRQETPLTIRLLLTLVKRFAHLTVTSIAKHWAAKSLDSPTS